MPLHLKSMNNNRELSDEDNLGGRRDVAVLVEVEIILKMHSSATVCTHPTTKIKFDNCTSIWYYIIFICIVAFPYIAHWFHINCVYIQTVCTNNYRAFVYTLIVSIEIKVNPD